MGAIQFSLYLIAIALCIFATGVTTRPRRGKPLKFFTAFLLIQSATFALELAIAHPATPYRALWLALLMAGSLLLAPCLWLTFQESVAGARPSLRELPRSHALTIVAGALFTVPLALSAHGGTTFPDPANPTSWLESKLIHTTMLLCVGVFIVQVPWYLARCRQLLLAKLEGRRDHWAQLPLAIVATTWGLAILRTLDCAFLKWPPLYSIVVPVVSVGVTGGALYLLLRRHGVPDEPAVKPEPDAPKPYEKSPLSPAARNRIRRKLEAALADPAIYKRNDMTLKVLGVTLNESAHYLSQVISQNLDSTFYELLNRRRIEAARQRLRDAPDETVLTIAMDVGFNSKSAFHTAFRRVTGTTPTAWRNGDIPRFLANGDTARPD